MKKKSIIISLLVALVVVIGVAAGVKAGITGMDWLGLVLISFVLPAVLTWLLALPLRKWKWIKEGDLALDL